MAPSQFVKPPRVAATPGGARMQADLDPAAARISTATRCRRWMVLGQVVGAFIDDRFIVRWALRYGRRQPDRALRLCRLRRGRKPVLDHPPGRRLGGQGCLALDDEDHDWKMTVNLCWRSSRPPATRAAGLWPTCWSSIRAKKASEWPVLDAAEPAGGIGDRRSRSAGKGERRRDCDAWRLITQPVSRARAFSRLARIEWGRSSISAVEPDLRLRPDWRRRVR